MKTAATPLGKTEGRTLAGRCLCGAVEYRVVDEFLHAANCHCSSCRRTTGSAFKPFAGIEREKLSVVRGEEKLLTYGHVALGTLVDEPSIRPTKDIFVGSKAPWLTITDDLPQSEEHARP